MNDYIPLKGAKVRVYKDSELVRFGYTDYSGRADFILQQGSYNICASKDGYIENCVSIDLIEDTEIEIILRRILRYLSKPCVSISDKLGLTGRPLRRYTSLSSLLVSDSYLLYKRGMLYRSTGSLMVSDSYSISLVQEYCLASPIHPDYVANWIGIPSWDRVLSFCSGDELSEFPYRQSMGVVDNTLRLTSSIYGYVQRTQPYTYACYVVYIANPSCCKSIVIHGAYDSYNEKYADIDITCDGSSCELRIDTGTAVYPVGVIDAEKWYAIVLSKNHNKYYVYDKNGNLLYTIDVSEYIEPDTYNDIGLSISVSQDEQRDEVYIDWIGWRE